MEYVIIVEVKEYQQMGFKSLIKIIEIILIISIVFDIILIFNHLNHDCTHDNNCKICVLIHKIKDDLKSFSANIVNLFEITLLFFSIKTSIFINNIINKKQYTPVGLNVELIN